WPQSGERFRGRDNALAAGRTQPEMPTPAGELLLLGCGDVWVSMVPLRYREEVHHDVGVFELRDGLIARTTEYFGAPFPAPEARARFTERD
ncbi:MAG: nuclear transport factor 2 family protein, partial [Candidatus Limnocylindrales bacterium]